MEQISPPPPKSYVKNNPQTFRGSTVQPCLSQRLWGMLKVTSLKTGRTSCLQTLPAVFHLPLPASSHPDVAFQARRVNPKVSPILFHESALARHYSHRTWEKFSSHLLPAGCFCQELAWKGARQVLGKQTYMFIVI